MSTNSTNPLSQFFRQPSIFLKLPSGGKWWPDGSLDLPITGEVAVCSMTAGDELLLKTPDALLNGQGMISVIQSCCPAILDAWQMPSVDVDAVLISIRNATYGSMMSFDSRCPSCAENNEHEVDLTNLMDQQKFADYSGIIQHGELKIKLQPQPYYDLNRANAVSFEEQKLAQVLEQMKDLDLATRAAQMDQSVARLIKLNIDSLTASTEYIELQDDRRVTNREFIHEFYSNTNAVLSKKIKEKLNSIHQESKTAPLQLKCMECEQQYSTELTFDYSSFFGKGS
jgi:hypothetical protein